MPEAVTNPVIYGRFPKIINAHSPIEKNNKSLSSVLLLLVLFSLFSYYKVIILFLTDKKQ